MLGLGADLCGSFDLPRSVRRSRRLFFYPGSSIGNFSPMDALALLQRLRGAAGRGDGVLIGVDLLKEEATLVAAYDDPLGITAAFNRNVLRNVNRIVATDFDVDDWCHVASFDRQASRIQMHLHARGRSGCAGMAGSAGLAKASVSIPRTPTSTARAISRCCSKRPASTTRCTGPIRWAGSRCSTHAPEASRAWCHNGRCHGGRVPVFVLPERMFPDERLHHASRSLLQWRPGWLVRRAPPAARRAGSGARRRT